ncbi:MAG: M48 family metallopeptidase [Rickettsiales bacterium]
MKNLAWLGALALVCACAAPTTYYPSVDHGEMQSEAKYQSAQARDAAAFSRSTPAERKDDEARLLRVAKKIGPSGAALCAEMRGSFDGCSFDFAMSEQEGANAYADGSKIFVTREMANFASKDDEMATVLGHEYAHNILRHVASTQRNVMIGTLAGTAADALAQSQGVNSGGAFAQLGAYGAQMRYSQDFEREADYVGLYIMARAGYKVNDASAFWRKMATRFPDGIYTGGTHPTSAERYISLNKTAAEITQKRESGKPLRPSMR